MKKVVNIFPFLISGSTSLRPIGALIDQIADTLLKISFHLLKLKLIEGEYGTMTLSEMYGLLY